MKHSLTIAAALAGLLLAAVPLSAADAPTRPLDFAKDVRPILAKNCFACHGTDETHREGGLRLDLRDAAIKKLEDGKTAIVPGHAERSELVRRITAAKADDRMPPADANATLTKDQIGLLTRWVAEGARYSLHWSFEKPVRPPLLLREPSRLARQCGRPVRAGPARSGQHGSLPDGRSAHARPPAEPRFARPAPDAR